MDRTRPCRLGRGSRSRPGNENKAGRRALRTGGGEGLLHLVVIQQRTLASISEKAKIQSCFLCGHYGLFIKV